MQQQQGNSANPQHISYRVVRKPQPPAGALQQPSHFMTPTSASLYTPPAQAQYPYAQQARRYQEFQQASWVQQYQPGLQQQATVVQNMSVPQVILQQPVCIQQRQQQYPVLQEPYSFPNPTDVWAEQQKSQQPPVTFCATQDSWEQQHSPPPGLLPLPKPQKRGYSSRSQPRQMMPVSQALHSPPSTQNNRTQPHQQRGNIRGSVQPVFKEEAPNNRKQPKMLPRQVSPKKSVSANTPSRTPRSAKQTPKKKG